MRRSTVLSLPPKLVLGPGLRFSSKCKARMEIITVLKHASLVK